MPMFIRVFQRSTARPRSTSAPDRLAMTLERTDMGPVAPQSSQRNQQRWTRAQPLNLMFVPLQNGHGLICIDESLHSTDAKKSLRLS